MEIDDLRGMTDEELNDELDATQQALMNLRFRVATMQLSNVNEIKSAKMIILPGVGAFGQAMNSLKRLGLDDAIKEAILNQSFLLGICLGYQMLFDDVRLDHA